MIEIERYVPMRFKTVGAFRAADPWWDDQVTDFTIEAYKMVPEKMHEGRRRKVRAAYDLSFLFGMDRYGIKSETDGEERMLPESLTVLWKTKRIQPESLPALLKELEPTLANSDYTPYLRTKVQLLLFVFLGLLAVAFGGLLYSQIQQQRLEDSRRSPPVPLEAWLPASVRNGPVVYPRTLKIVGKVSLEQNPTAPKGVIHVLSPKWQLGWVKGRDGHRLVLWDRGYFPMPGLFDASGDALILESRAIGLATETLSKLKKQLPDLQADHVWCDGWFYRQDPHLHLPWIMLGVVAFGGTLGTMMKLLVIWSRRRRQKRQVAWALERVGFGSA